MMRNNVLLTELFVNIIDIFSGTGIVKKKAGYSDGLL